MGKHKVNGAKIGFCKACGETCFKLPCRLPGLGRRDWWHDAFVLDKQHTASPRGGYG